MPQGNESVTTVVFKEKGHQGSLNNNGFIIMLYFTSFADDPRYSVLYI